MGMDMMPPKEKDMDKIRLGLLTLEQVQKIALEEGIDYLSPSRWKNRQEVIRQINKVRASRETMKIIHEEACRCGLKR